MTKKCEIHKIGIDLPCYKPAKNSIKFISKKIGNKEKGKIPICDQHYKMLDDCDKIEDLLEGQSDMGDSEVYTAMLIKGRT